MTQRIIKDRSKYKALIARTIKSGLDFKTQLQSALSSACYHALTHGDVTLLNELIVGTNENVANNAHKKWIVANAGEYLAWAGEKEGFKVKPAANEIRKVPDAVAAHEERLETAVPYYQATKPQSFDGMSVTKMLGAIIAKHEGIMKKKDETMSNLDIDEEEFMSKIDARGLTQVRLLLANLQAGVSENRVVDTNDEGSGDIAIH